MQLLVEAIEGAGFRPGEDIAHRPRPGHHRVLRRRQPTCSPARAGSSARAEMADYWSTCATKLPDRVDRGRHGRGGLGRLGRCSPRRSATGSSSWATTCSSPTSSASSGASTPGVANSILVKVNQIGSLTETLDDRRPRHPLGVHLGDVAPLGRDRGRHHRRPRGRHQLRPDQDRRARPAATGWPSTTSCCASRRTSASPPPSSAERPWPRAPQDEPTGEGASRGPPPRREPVAARRRSARRAPTPGRRVAIGLAVSVLLVGFLLVGVFPTRTWLAQRDELGQKEAELAAIRADEADLEDRIDTLETPEEIERIAREEYGMTRPGEKPYRILPAPEEPVDLPRLVALHRRRRLVEPLADGAARRGRARRERPPPPVDRVGRLGQGRGRASTASATASRASPSSSGSTTASWRGSPERSTQARRLGLVVRRRRREHGRHTGVEGQEGGVERLGRDGPALGERRPPGGSGSSPHSTMLQRALSGRVARSRARVATSSGSGCCWLRATPRPPTRLDGHRVGGQRSSAGRGVGVGGRRLGAARRRSRPPDGHGQHPGLGRPRPGRRGPPRPRASSPVTETRAGSTPVEHGRPPGPRRWSRHATAPACRGACDQVAVSVGERADPLAGAGVGHPGVAQGGGRGPPGARSGPRTKWRPAMPPPRSTAAS